VTEPVVLDSFALVSLFHKEQGWRKVRDILQSLLTQGQKALFCHSRRSEYRPILKTRLKTHTTQPCPMWQGADHGTEGSPLQAL
jgi:hypothetical protein